MSDDKLDRMFKEAAEKHEPEYNPGNWEKMSQLLDNPIPPAGSGGGSILGWKGMASVITLAIVGSVFYYGQQEGFVSKTNSSLVNVREVDGSNEEVTGNDQVIESNNSVSHPEDISTSSELTAQAEVDNNQSLQNTRANDPASPSNNSKSVEGIKQSVVRNLSVDRNVAVASGESSRSLQKMMGETRSVHEKSSPSIIQSEASQSLSVGVITNASPESSEGSVANDEPAQLKAPIDNESENTKSNKSSVLTKQEIGSNEVSSKDNTEGFSTPRNPSALPAKLPTEVSTDSLTREEKVLTGKEKSENEVAKSETEKRERDEWLFPRGFSIKVGVSPDFSSVKFRPSSGMGVNAGLQAEYRFANHWSVSTGIITSKKVYSGSDVKYEASNSQIYIADDMEGGCTVLDVPLNISYSFGNPDRTSYFITTGLSSYLMMSENYTWSYDNGSTFNVTASRENNDWFKQLNFSVGIQRRLSSHFYLQFEPFVKAPLAGVGEGKVSLTSLGAFINLRYSFNK